MAAISRISAASRIVLALAFGGCASDRGQYAFAPPLAPPVYPQPAGYATPVVPSAASPVAAAPGPVAAPITASGAAVATAPVDPCAGVIPAGVVVETPCPDAGMVMQDGAVIVTGMAGDECCGGEIVVR